MSETTELKIYNTLTRTKEIFRPLDPDNVRMYVCGPTVYDFAHIGNARPAIVFDVLFRLLRHLYGDSHVTYVRNITDVDDKINARALRDFGKEIAAGALSLNEAIRRVTETTYNQYQKDVAALGCLKPTYEPRATEFVLPRQDGKADMVTLIQSLIDRGHAYVAAGEVLFDTASMADYGQLSKRRLDEQQAGARVEVDAHKKNPGDFVLWKESSPEEPGWDASFRLTNGATAAIRGRPGWHIECSAMSAAYLGEVFDIHGGGLDLIFPHHENEIAQSRCAHGTAVMANYWMHNGFLQVEGRKMSKSEGNFVTIHELLETGSFGGRRWPGEVLRLAMLMTHYREPIDFSVRRLEEAENRLAKWRSRTAILKKEQLTAVNSELLQSLLDDVNTPGALNALDALCDQPSSDQNTIAMASSLFFLGLQGSAEALVVLMKGLAHQFEDQFKYYSVKQLRSFEETQAFYQVWNKVDVNIELERRLAYIHEKNWAEADKIRDELLVQGIRLKDGKDPATGERVTTWEVKR